MYQILLNFDFYSCPSGSHLVFAHSIGKSLGNHLKFLCKKKKLYDLLHYFYTIPIDLLGKMLYSRRRTVGNWSQKCDIRSNNFFCKIFKKNDIITFKTSLRHNPPQNINYIPIHCLVLENLSYSYVNMCRRSKIITRI